jgi:hypothetical protein
MSGSAGKDSIAPIRPWSGVVFAVDVRSKVLGSQDKMPLSLVDRADPMQALLQYFLDLALLRRGPQDLPASSALLALVALGGVVVGAVNGQAIFGGLGPAAGANLFDMALTMAMLYLLLQFKGHVARWLQTTTAFLGIGLGAGVAMLLLGALAQALGAKEITVLADLLLAVWLHVVLGHVLRHALDIPLLAGVIIVFAYTMIAFNLVIIAFPIAANG